MRASFRRRLSTEVDNSTGRRTLLPRTYARAGDNFGRYLALSVTVCVVVQALINVSVVLDIVPNKGIPLPFISYGGSSLLSTLLLMGMLLSVSEHAA